MISRRALIAGAAGLVASPALAFPVVEAAPRRLDVILKRAGVWSDCSMCFDAADERSYLSGQTWFDLSANARNVVRGANTGASTDDPTFTGTPGHLTASEYFAFDGGDYFTKATANDAFVNSWHKDNALYTWGCWYYWPAAFKNGRLLGTKTNSAASIGVFWGPNASGSLSFFTANGSATQSLTLSSTRITPNAWNFSAFTMDEGASVYADYLNGQYTAGSGNYTSPTASDASLTLTLGSRATPDQFLPSGARMAMFFATSTAMTQAELDKVYELTRRRFA